MLTYFNKTIRNWTIVGNNLVAPKFLLATIIRKLDVHHLSENLNSHKMKCTTASI